MALAVTLLGSTTFNTSSGTKTVTATPAVNDLIVIVTAHTGNTSTTAPTDDQGGTYSLITSTFKNVSADGLAVFVRDSLIASNVSTVFTHAPGTTTGGGLAVLKVTGSSIAGSAAIRQSAREINKSIGGIPTPVFSSAALTANGVIGAVFIGFGSPAMTPRTSPLYTERSDDTYSSPSANLEVMSINSGETGTSISWNNGAAGEYCDIVIEIRLPQVLSPGLFTNTNTFYGPTVTRGTNFLTPDIFTETNTFYAPTIAAGGAMSAALFTNSNTFYAPSIKYAPLTPGILTNTNSFFAPSIGVTSSFEPPLLANDNTFFPATLTGWTILSPGTETWTRIA